MRILALLPIALLALSGCSTPPEVTTPPVPIGPLLPDGTPAPLALAFTDCAEQLGVFPVEESDVAPYLPAGFAPVTFQDTPFVTMVIVSYACQNGNATVHEAMRAVQVTPPANWTNADARLHILPIEVFTDRQDLLDVYAAWGANSTHALGSIELAVPTPENPVLRAGRLSVTGPNGGFTMDSAAPMGAAEVPGSARLFVVDAALNVTGAVDVAWSASAMGTDMGTAMFGYSAAAGPSAIPMAAPGISFHFWGNYAYNLTYVPAPY